MLLVNIIVALAVAAGSGPPQATSTQLAGRSLAEFPYFEYVRSFNPDEPVEIAIDPGQLEALRGRTCDLYVVAARDEALWNAKPSLEDVRADGPQTVQLRRGTLRQNTFIVVKPGELSHDAGAGLGVGYDVVLDCDGDGTLSRGDYIDGWGDEAGLYAVHDTTRPGPLEVVEILYNGGSFLRQKIYYPENIAAMGLLPLVVVSHGWTHDYRWYDHIGRHLASYGYVVMAHSNDVGFGNPAATFTAAVTTLNNTDYFLGSLQFIGHGVLQGHVDPHRIVWIGHSTGGEGVVRAYTRLRDGSFVPEHYGAGDIVLISAIAPVSWLSPGSVHPRDVNYHTFIGGADTDVSGAPYASFTQPMAIYERGYGNKQLTYIQGVGHGDFHDGSGPPWADGPDLIGREATHQVVRGYYLPLVELYTRDNPAAKDYFTRMYDGFHPPGIPAHVIVATEYKEAESMGSFVLDDYQTQLDPRISSSGGKVSFEAAHLDEIRMRDVDGSFAWNGLQASNGMTRSLAHQERPRCVALDWNPEASAYYELEVVDAQRDFSDDEHLFFRACQGTRHPETDALDAPLTFTVTLRDGTGTESSIHIGNYGRITRTYKRQGLGPGAGWGNEFNTVRIRLADFAGGGTGLDLTDIVALRFDFGAGFGSERGRIGLDDIRITPVRFGGQVGRPAVTRRGGRSTGRRESLSGPAPDRPLRPPRVTPAPR